MKKENVALLSIQALALVTLINYKDSLGKWGRLGK